LSHWDPYSALSLEAVACGSYCNTAGWFWWDFSLSQWFCFDSVGWVIWFVKIVPEMTYKVSSRTLSLFTLAHTLSLPRSCAVQRRIELLFVVETLATLKLDRVHTARGRGLDATFAKLLSPVGFLPAETSYLLTSNVCTVNQFADDAVAPL